MGARMNLDRLDQQLISALEDDGRRPYRDIARDLDVAEATVRARVGRLVEAGLIRITAVGDPLRLGVNVVAISLIRVKPGSVQNVAEILTRYPNVRFVGTSFGAADIIVQTLHADVKALHRFVTQDLPKAAPDITRTETFQLAEVLKSSWEWKAWFAQGEMQEPPEKERRAPDEKVER